MNERAQMSMTRIALASICFVLTGCYTGAPGGAGAPCQSNNQCATYVCNCADGVSVQRNGCTSGACIGATGLCDNCSTHGGSNGYVTTIPPVAGPDSGADSGAGGGGGADGGFDFCKEIDKEYGCYKPIYLGLANFVAIGQSCAAGHTKCGDECPNDAQSPSWCCPPGTECSSDEQVLLNFCQDGLNYQQTYTCVPNDAYRCNYNYEERKAAYTSAGDVGDMACNQHGLKTTKGHVYDCDRHGKPSETKCVPYNHDVLAPLCPAEAAACVPTGP